MDTDGHVHHPYVISADLHGLMVRWAQQHSMRIPDDAYFAQVVRDLECEIIRNVGVPVEIVDERELRRGLSQMIINSIDPVISLDRAYIDETHPNVVGFIDLTRAVDESFSDVGMHPRPGSFSVNEQLAAYHRMDVRDVGLVDDVIFSGEGLVQVIELLKYINCRVVKVFAGIGISHGVEKVRETGVIVECVREYRFVVDEVCQRDFVAGVPMSGRSMMDTTGEWWSAPYFLPFGYPEKWASIPADRAKAFSDFCIRQSYDLWKQIERLNRRKIPPFHAPRRVKALCADAECDSITRALKHFF